MVISTFSYNSWGQLFTDRNLYEVLREVENKLNDGKFDDALKLCQIYPKEKVFIDLVTNTKILKNIYSIGSEHLKNGKAKQAYETFNSYRKYSSKDLRIFGLATQKSLELIGKGLEKKTNAQKDQLEIAERRIYGLGKVIQGKNQLSILDTTRAEASFRSARDKAAKYDAQVASETEKGLKIIEGLKQWGKRFRELQIKQLTTEERIAILEDYRKATGNEVSIKELEEKIEYLKKSGAFPPNVSPDQRMMYFAQNCKTEILAAYVKDNEKDIPQASQINSFLEQNRQTEMDINQLKQDPSRRELTKDAYEKLIETASRVPMLGTALKVCAQKNYYDYLIQIVSKSEQAADINNNDKSILKEALKNLSIARELNIPETDPETLPIQKRIAAKIGCDDFIKNFKRMVIVVRRSLSNCRLIEARQNWSQAVNTLSGCEANRDIMKPYKGLRDSISIFIESDSILNENIKNVKSLIVQLDCEKAKTIYEKLRTLKVCNSVSLKKIITEGLANCAECEREKCYLSFRKEANQLEDAENWKAAYKSYEKAFNCANEVEKQEILASIDIIQCKVFPKKCRQNNTYFRPEIVGAYSLIKPTYTIGDKKQEMTVWHHISAGLQLSLINHSSPVDLSIGAEYFQTQFQSLGTIKDTKYVLEEFSLRGINGFATVKIHKGNTDPDRWRPYLKIGAEAMVPLSYRYENYTTRTIIEDKKQLSPQSFSGIGGIGIELQRKHFGCFLEVFGSYNFSSIYNVNASNPSTTLNSSINAHIHRAGVRIGVRLW